MNKHNYIKPIVGVFLGKSSINKFHKQKPVSQKIMELLKANEQAKTTLYYFSIADVNMKNKMINGTFFNKQKNRWEIQEFPYPDIIYKRCSSAKREIYFFEAQLKMLNVKSLNYLHGFNKWEVYQRLSTNESLLPHLPATFLYHAPADLSKMFDSTDRVYLKACRGARGKQVIRVTKLPAGEYEVSFFNSNLSVNIVKDFDCLVNMIIDFFGNKKFIIQEAIDLITINDSLVDMRPEVQKNEKGEIVLAAIPVRLGNVNAPITTHAASYTFEEFFAGFMNYSETDIEALKNRIIEFLKIVYQTIEKFYGPSGEIGIDIGLDKKGQLWFIECNSQSKKVSFFNAYDKNTIEKSYLNLLGYTRFLYENKEKND
ncbi:MAG: YheC/YheD family protein [Peptococcaceae bacterium]